MANGRVYLIGAGPGDPGLLTLRGAELLGRADVVLYDALAHPALLAHAAPGAELRSVGKRYGEDSFSQAAINDELVALARAGKVVARLKGGDPLLFARGAEEIEALASAGIPFEIVPGVPSPTGAAAYAGISLTHRDLSSSVAFITGTESPGKERTAHDWSKLATATQTLCVIMGMRRLGEVARSLVEHGRAPETPVAVVQWGTWPRQRVVSATLADVEAKVAAAGVTNPAVIVVGEVARLRERMRWWDAQPLFGKRVVVTRAAHQAASTAAKLRELGAEPVLVPVIELAPPPDPERLDRAVLELDRYDLVAFTSVNGVERFFARIDALGRDARAFGRASVAAIGPATAEALAARGVRADVVADEYRGEGLARAILERAGDAGASGRRALLARALVARDALPDALRAAGFAVDVVAAYETRPAPREAASALAEQLRQRTIDVVTFTSSSTVRQMCAALGADAKELLAHTCVASIGPVTTEEAKRHGIRVDVEAETYTIDGLFEAISRWSSDRVE